MSSPFSVFRKHQKGLMAGLIIVAMVSFVVLGTAEQFLDSGGSGGGPQEDRIIATWTGGKFTQKELNQLVYNRISLNNFIRGVMFMEARNRGEEQLRPYHEYNTRNEKDIIRTALLVEEANKLGIVVSDAQVETRIKALSQDSVTDSQLNTVLREISDGERPVSYPQIIEAYRREMLAEQAKLVYGSPDANYDSLATPAQRWDYFCRLNRRVTMQVYPFPVDRYISDPRIPEPSDSQLRAFYEEHKDDVQSPSSPEPGFKEPAGVKLEYLKADYVKFFEAAKAKLTDEEIRKDFEKYKETMRLNLEFDERMSSYDDILKKMDADESKDDDKPVVKAPEPDPTPYETAVGRFAKRAPKATEPRFTDDEILHRNRESIVKRLAEERARDDMQKALEVAYQKMQRFYDTEYRRWSLSNVAKEDEDDESKEPATPPPAFDLAKLASPDAGLTYHQTAVMSREELFLDKYLGQTFVNRRWGMEKDPQTDIETLRLVEPGTPLHNSTFQTKTKMSPFRAEDQIQGSSEAFYRNQYVFWKTADREQNVPAFDDIEDRVRRAWKIANDTGKSARDFARQQAERLAQEINGNKDTLKKRFADSKDVKETSEFTWYEDRLKGTGFGPIPVVRQYPIRTKLEEVEVGGDRFYREVFRLADKKAGAAMNDSGSIVYAVQVFDAPDAKIDTLQERFLRSPYSEVRRGLSFIMQSGDVPDQQGYAIVSAYDMVRNAEDWYEQLERDYDVEWAPAEDQ